MKRFPPVELQRRTFAPLLFLLIVVCLSSVAAVAQTGVARADRQLQLWQTYTFPEGNFKISLPAEPLAGTRILSSEDVPDIVINTLQLNAAHSVYEIAFVKLPRKIDKERLEAAGEASSLASDEIFKKINGTVISSENVSKNGVIIYETVAKIASATVKARRYYTATHVYEVVFITPDLLVASAQIKQVYQAEADKFFNSFQILDNKQQAVRSTKGKAK